MFLPQPGHNILRCVSNGQHVHTEYDHKRQSAVDTESLSTIMAMYAVVRAIISDIDWMVCMSIGCASNFWRP